MAAISTSTSPTAIVAKSPVRVLVGPPKLNGARLPPLPHTPSINTNNALTIPISDSIPSSARGAPRTPNASRNATSRPASATPRPTSAAPRPASAVAERPAKGTAKCCRAAQSVFSIPLQCAGITLACCHICVYEVAALPLCCLAGCCEETRECAVGMCRIGWLNCKVAPTAICSLCCIKIICAIPSCCADCCCPSTKESLEIAFYENVSFVCYNKMMSECCCSSCCCCTSLEDLEDKVNKVAIDCCFASRPSGTHLGQDVYQMIYEGGCMQSVLALTENRSFYQNILPANLAKRKEKLGKPVAPEMQRSPIQKSGGAEVYVINEGDDKADEP